MTDLLVGSTSDIFVTLIDASYIAFTIMNKTALFAKIMVKLIAHKTDCTMWHNKINTAK